MYADFWRPRADEVAYIDLDYHRTESPQRGIVAQWACAKPWQALCITWNGRILPCNHDFAGEVVLGTVGKNALAEVWHGPQMEEMRHLHQQGLAHQVPICDKCILRFCEISRLQS